MIHESSSQDKTLEAYSYRVSARFGSRVWVTVRDGTPDGGVYALHLRTPEEARDLAALLDHHAN